MSKIQPSQKKFGTRFPKRFFETFIAEQNMIGTAAGLAACGKIPFAATFACFLTRGYDFIRMAAISQANIKLMGSHAECQHWGRWPITNGPLKTCR